VRRGRSREEGKKNRRYLSGDEAENEAREENSDDVRELNAKEDPLFVRLKERKSERPKRRKTNTGPRRYKIYSVYI
jgi:hypothetical protein